jgi:hypothetical protein
MFFLEESIGAQTEQPGWVQQKNSIKILLYICHSPTLISMPLLKKKKARLAAAIL